MTDVPLEGLPPDGPARDRANYERRQAALDCAAARLAGRETVSDTERDAALDAIEAARAERDEQLTHRPRR